MSDVALDQHALLSDCGAAALVTSAGSVDWLCLPRFDSPAVFARLLDDDAGHFLLAPAEGGTAHRGYRPNGLVLESTWTTDGGVLVTKDALALGRGRGHRLGRNSPGVLLRSARCTAGEVAVRVEYAPRPEFGLVHPRLTVERGAVIARGGPTALIFSTPVAMEIAGATASAVVLLKKGQEITFALQQSPAWAPAPRRRSRRAVRRTLRVTERTWRSWSKLHQAYDGPHRDLVLHSGIVLQALTYAPTGAIVAAPTSSLPEGIGSGRTWDYRFTWVRDASLTMQGLFIAACPAEAGRFFSFLATAASTQLDRGRHLQVMFGVGAERDLAEHELDHLSGWRNSGPVRTGNGAWSQCQLDVYGALLDAAYSLRAELGDLDAGTRGLLVAAVDAAAARWQEDDQGIWEVRGPPRPFLHSKLMCWLALERGLAMTTPLEPGPDRTATWRAAREEIRAAILAEGWSERAGAFGQSFGSDDLDASALLLATTGFLPPDDERLLATIDAVETELSDKRGLLCRYRAGDGIDTSEGTFLLCTFWLAAALAVTGQRDRARVVLDRAAAYASDLGLFAEQVDSASGELLGNFPQAFSHLGLITAAHALGGEGRPEP